MNTIIEITDINHPEAQIFSRLTEAQLCDASQRGCGLFIAESPKVISVALDAGYEPVALLCERKQLSGDAAQIIKRMHDDVRIMTGEREVLSAITGYRLTRGVLCAMKRRTPPTVDEICGNARRIVIIDGVSDTTNIGAIFRSAAALGIDGALLTPTACDPLNRRAVRVSMGSVFLLPWTFCDDPAGESRRHGFKTVAMALRHDSVTITDECLKREPRLAIMMGTEGDGLDYDTIKRADYTVKIPMYHGVDSLNVAAASAVAFWELASH